MENNLPRVLRLDICLCELGSWPHLTTFIDNNKEFYYTPGARHCCYHPFAERESEAQEGKITGPSWHDNSSYYL